MWFPASPPEPRTALGPRGCSRRSWGRERLGARQGRAPPAVWTRVPRTCLRTCLRRSVSARLPCRVPRPDGRPPIPRGSGKPLCTSAPSHTQGDPRTSHGCCDRYTRCPPRRFLLPAFEARLRWAAVRSGARGAARGPPSPAGGSRRRPRRMLQPTAARALLRDGAHAALGLPFLRGTLAAQAGRLRPLRPAPRAPRGSSPCSQCLGSPGLTRFSLPCLTVTSPLPESR